MKGEGRREKKRKRRGRRRKEGREGEGGRGEGGLGFFSLSIRDGFRPLKVISELYSE